MTQDITQLSVTELKAAAYDTLGRIELEQRNLQVINAEIAKKQNEPQEETKLTEEEVI